MAGCVRWLALRQQAEPLAGQRWAASPEAEDVGSRGGSAGLGGGALGGVGGREDEADDEEWGDRDDIDAGAKEREGEKAKRGAILQKAISMARDEEAADREADRLLAEIRGRGGDEDDADDDGGIDGHSGAEVRATSRSLPPPPVLQHLAAGGGRDSVGADALAADEGEAAKEGERTVAAEESRLKHSGGSTAEEMDSGGGHEEGGAGAGSNGEDEAWIEQRRTDGAAALRGKDYDGLSDGAALEGGADAAVALTVSSGKAQEQREAAPLRRSKTKSPRAGRLRRRELAGSGSSKRKAKHAACEIDDLADVAAAMVPPSFSPKFQQFSLSYVERDDRPPADASASQLWQPRFNGHQSLAEREATFVAQDMRLHCGFVQPPDGGPPGFELAPADRLYMARCSVVVSSAVFGNWDRVKSPSLDKMSAASRRHVCFVMFVDQESLLGFAADNLQVDDRGRVGLWRIVLVKSMPYNDPRRTGKVPKLLPHRLFPNARYSIWIDSKLRLQVDPLAILERFLWRGGHEYAISNHYDRHCVWDEVAQNKKLNKYNHTVIDEQFAFYRADGLTRFDPHDPGNLLPSYVPEGSFIVRAHTPMANLFSCLWFNEVDRWTSRDQLSFAYTFLKLTRSNPTTKFHLHMFKDCQRKSLARLFKHRSEEALLLAKLRRKRQPMGDTR
eukprot:SM000186S04125  [mRNA]  locus=s186:6288:10670:- [translate_table: standard]